ncbi:MAG TPA: amidohydrolase family protein [Phycisphaerales bacterium]|nr:amidohydrolase family protein [Phycisphaerales bacterium]
MSEFNAHWSRVLVRAAGLATIALSGWAAAQPSNPPAQPPVKSEGGQSGEVKKEAEKKDESKWDVSKPPTDGTLGGWGWKDVSIDVTEGTWMSLDVSPDGKTIVFDMLGDIYTMPIEGSADGSGVTCIASGLAWDMQPRFSPDGSLIAFVSDRTGENGKGGDNVWVMGVDGGAPRQITKETFRLVTQPVWTPDGQGIIARKHFTSRRSLGAGEMWRWSATGKGDGLQLTAKQTEQKDTGEPAISKDGRYLYYSLDATPGANFEYDKDSNGGIYAIDRVDLRDQKTERVISGPGGACRPVPSPDGKSLAFVKRVRYQTCLFVLDLASGQPRMVFDALERDNQETWAVHGVYPSMAWTPDGKELVFWAKGKIHRLHVGSGKVAEVPFRVKGTRQIADAVRFPVDVAPAGVPEFDVKMLQSTQYSPKGDRVVFQAMGQVYVADAADGKVGAPRRLTKATDEFEFYPAWSRDGSQVVFVGWNDERLATIRVCDIATGKVEAVTNEPGHYIDPVFTPDGSRIAWSKTSGGYLTSPLWGRDPGVYIGGNPLSGKQKAGDARRIGTRGGSPHFGADASRIFVVARDGGSDSDKVSLLSYPVDGLTPQAGEIVHARSDWATEMRVSPDGRWLAFAERFNVYVTPMMQVGKPVDLSPSTTTVPVAKLSSQAGQYLQWSGDSGAIHWALGPELYTQALPASVVDPLAAARAEEKLPEATSVHIGMKAAYDAPVRADGAESVIVIRNVKILTMRDAAGDSAAAAKRALEVIEKGAIVIRGNRIESVGAEALLKIPAGAEVIDGKGGVVTPGLIDVHAHGPQGENGYTPQNNWSAHANLAFGVTTIHDPSNDTESIFAASELARAGKLIAPRTYSTGTILYGATGSFRAEIESLDDAIFHLKRMKAVGAFSVKSYNQPRRDQRQMILEAGRRVGIMVVPEGGALYQHNMTMVVDGHTSVEHTLPVEVIYDDVKTLWGASQTGYTPTLGVAYGGMGGENYWYAKTNVWANEHLMHFVPRYVVDPRSRRRTDAPDEEWNHVKESKVAKDVLDAKAAGVGAAAKRGGHGNETWGGPTLGAHGQLAGLAAHWELWMLVQGGMSPMEALRAGTIDGAWYIGLDRELGSLEAGKLADLILFSEDVSQDIRKTSSISMVMVNGRLYDAKDLSQVAPLRRPGPRYFFEELQRGSSTPMAVEAIMRKAAMEGGTCAGCGGRH